MNSQELLDWHFHASQTAVRLSGARFKVVCCGRRWGKTRLAWMLLFWAALAVRGVYWWVAPRYKELQAVRQTIRECMDVSLCFSKFTEVSMGGVTVLRYCLLPNGSEIFFQSADTEDSMRGQGLSGVVCDEMELIDRSRWENELRPSLMDKKGWALFIGTPKGHNLFWELYVRGQGGGEWPEWESWSFPSWDNPFIDRAEVEGMAKGLPKQVYEQEILARFLDDVGQVFRGIFDCVDRSLEMGSRQTAKYVCGADLAKTEDFQVHVALDFDGNLRGIERFNELDWVLQKKRLVNFAKTFNDSRILIDSTGLGDPIFDELRRESVRVDGYKFNLASKADLIENLSIMLDQRKVRFPDPDRYPQVRVLLDELSSYGYELGSKTGTIMYRAPEGLHDDTVVALALAAWQLKTSNNKPWAATFSW